MRRSGFTLFELVLAVALSGVLLMLLAAAINLFLLECNASRTEVEEAQLARAVLEMIATDLRRVIVHEPQDTSTVAAIAEAAALYNVDEIDSPADATSSLESLASGGSSSSGDTAASPSASSGLADQFPPPGLYGNLGEVTIDVSRLPRAGDWTGLAAEQDVAAAPVEANRYSDIKSVRYFVNQPGMASGMAVSSMAVDPQAVGSGLIRQEVDRAVRKWAEQAGDSAVLATGARLVAPEVVGLQFRFFDGSTALEVWDTHETAALPLAVEVRIWILSPAANGRERTNDSHLATGAIPEGANEYLLTVDLPMATANQASAAGSSAELPP